MSGDPIRRYVEMLAERNLIPFQRPFGVRLRWRVSPDEWERLSMVAAEAAIESVGVGECTMLGWRIVPDAVLPPRSVVLEDA